MFSFSALILVVLGALSELRTSHSFTISRNPAIKVSKLQYPRLCLFSPMILEVNHSIDPNTLPSSGTKYEDPLYDLNKLVTR